MIRTREDRKVVTISITDFSNTDDKVINVTIGINDRKRGAFSLTDKNSQTSHEVVVEFVDLNSITMFISKMEELQVQYEEFLIAEKNKK